MVANVLEFSRKSLRENRLFFAPGFLISKIAARSTAKPYTPIFRLKKFCMFGKPKFYPTEMSDLRIFFEIGLRHVLDIRAYDHVLFLIALVVPYTFRDWRRVLLLVSFFTLGHTLALLLSVYGLLSVRVTLVELLIPITILVTALFQLFTAGKNPRKESGSIIGFVAVFFGVVHGLGFSHYFKTMLPGTATDKLLPLLEFALGIEGAQIIVVLVVLSLSYMVQHFFRFSRRDWTLVMSAFVAGVVIPLLVQSPIWSKN